MKSSRDKEPHYLEKDEYFAAKDRLEELYKLLEPWFGYGVGTFLKPGAPEGYDQLLIELQELGQNVYYTEFMNGVAY